MDLKPENLLIGDNYEMKITDFDSSYRKGDIMVLSKGTKNYRPNEIKECECKKINAADIYSSAIILFCFMFGNLPYLEDSLVEGNDLHDLMTNEQSKFWSFHQKMHSSTRISSEFKDLFEQMVKVNPQDRISID